MVDPASGNPRQWRLLSSPLCLESAFTFSFIDQWSTLTQTLENSQKLHEARFSSTLSDLNESAESCFYQKVDEPNL